MIVRPAGRSDFGFLADMLVEAVNWSPEWKRKSRRRVLAAPNTAHYLAGWPLEDDLGVVAESSGEPVGAAWLRFFSAEAPGYGFVAADVPELTIGVVASWRGRGVGRALLAGVEASARGCGIGRISLSVERKNFARELYLAVGYEVVGRGVDSDTMVKVL
ncbi:GNAT family N-acetyltransferase [Amycolatopsis sp. OK19-0408]|uniref:GNAT family N-acetyltransferase n=1 Tax=Amycolatopsis iheyensis TaxID=2945988 RepID=A0A9X2N494_9PSEU|nr:GNAT family N-acetyltransferase [Amycolatopsis iheyensis]MCR6482056.1 GNAT family N-acetyltransferase [Amycolatopsis iheyensis]